MLDDELLDIPSSTVIADVITNINEDTIVHTKNEDTIEDSIEDTEDAVASITQMKEPILGNKRRANRKNNQGIKKALESCLRKWKEALSFEENDIKTLAEIGIFTQDIFMDGVDSVSFPSTVDAKYRKVIHELCTTLNLFHASVGETPNRYILVSRDSIETNNENISYWYDPSVIKPKHCQHFYYDMNHMNQSYHGIALNAITDACTLECIDKNAIILIEYALDIDETSLLLDMDSNLVDKMRIFPTYTFVNTLDALTNMVEHLSNAILLAFDCEMHSFRSYYGITCLIQLSSDKNEHFLVDTIALWSYIHFTLQPLFANPNIIKIAHSVEGGDVPFLYRDFGIYIINLYDTRVAAISLGFKKQSLSAMLHHYNCVYSDEIMKEKEEITNSDWRVRPLSDRQLRYAILDVYYLIPLTIALLRDLYSRIHIVNASTLDNIWMNDDDGYADDEEEGIPFGLVDISIDDDDDDEADWEGWGVSSVQVPSCIEPCIEDDDGLLVDVSSNDMLIHSINSKTDENMAIINESIPISTDTINASDKANTVEHSVVEAVSEILAASQKDCAKLWQPKREKENEHLKLKEFKSRKKSSLWQERNTHVYARLFAWRERTARLEDESLYYICPNFFLVNSAFHLPQDYPALNKMWNPLPVFIKTLEETLQNGDNMNDGVEGFLQCICSAIEEWDATTTPV